MAKIEILLLHLLAQTTKDLILEDAESERRSMEAMTKRTAPVCAATRTRALIANNALRLICQGVARATHSDAISHLKVAKSYV